MPYVDVVGVIMSCELVVDPLPDEDDAEGTTPDEETAVV